MHLTGHSWTYLRDFWIWKKNWAKISPITAKILFGYCKGPPFGCYKIFFFKSIFYQIQVKAFGPTISKWYNTCVMKIFFAWNFVYQNLENIFWKFFLNKYLQKLFSIPKCYTILELWDRMQSNGFDKKMIWGDFKKNIFSNPKGGAFEFAKTVFAVRGGNFQPYAKPNM